jgi:hypothetical protein
MAAANLTKQTTKGTTCSSRYCQELPMLSHCPTLLHQHLQYRCHALNWSQLQTLQLNLRCTYGCKDLSIVLMGNVCLSVVVILYFWLLPLLLYSSLVWGFVYVTTIILSRMFFFFMCFLFHL